MTKYKVSFAMDTLASNRDVAPAEVGVAIADKGVVLAGPEE